MRSWSIVDGSMPSSSTSLRRTTLYSRRASACRPDRYRATISISASRSRHGYSIAIFLSSLITPPWMPATMQAWNLSSMAASLLSS